jgi:hypothetical protein
MEPKFFATAALFRKWKWVMSAKKEETRARRLDLLIEDSAAGRRLAAYTLEPRKKS